LFLNSYSPGWQVLFRPCPAQRFEQQSLFFLHAPSSTWQIGEIVGVAVGVGSRVGVVEAVAVGSAVGVAVAVAVGVTE